MYVQGKKNPNPQVGFFRAKREKNLIVCPPQASKFSEQYYVRRKYIETRLAPVKKEIYPPSFFLPPFPLPFFFLPPSFSFFLHFFFIFSSPLSFLAFLARNFFRRSQLGCCCDEMFCIFFRQKFQQPVLHNCTMAEFLLDFSNY